MLISQLEMMLMTYPQFMFKEDGRQEAFLKASLEKNCMGEVAGDGCRLPLTVISSTNADEQESSTTTILCSNPRVAVWSRISAFRQARRQLWMRLGFVGVNLEETGRKRLYDWL